MFCSEMQVVCLRSFGSRHNGTRESGSNPSDSSLNTFLLAAASMQKELSLGDCSTAFMQSDRSHGDRPKGILYAHLHPGGIPLEDGSWVEPGSILQLNTAVYGLVNAPAAWRKSLVRAIEDLGYRRSVYEPCIFALMHPTGLQGSM